MSEGGSEDSSTEAHILLLVLTEFLGLPVPVGRLQSPVVADGAVVLIH